MSGDDLQSKKYSRQALVYGEHATKRLPSLNVSICILHKNGFDMAYECCKNLMLSGIGNLQLNDKHKLLTPMLQKRISELNPEVTVQFTHNYDYVESALSTLDVFVLCGGSSLSEWVKYNSLCRTRKIWFVAAQIVEGRMKLWQDPGETHHIRDIDGQPCTDMFILHVEEDTVINVDQIDDMLRVSDQIIIQSKVFCVKAIHSVINQLEIVPVPYDTNQTDSTTRVHSGGYARRIPRQNIIHGKCFDDDDVEHYHNHNNAETSEEKRVHFALSSYVGAILSQEVIKQLGTFTPIVGYSEYNVLNHNHPQNRSSKKMSEMTLFVVGAGALGCELLKGLAEMICSENTEHTGRIIITDMDAIELSNLSRQFLYREADIGKLKAPTAAQAILKMYPHLNITGLSHAVCTETACSIFGSEFWNSINMVVTAVDNVDARLFIDEQCRWYRKPLIDSGTLGLRGSVQVVLPDYTETYSDSQDPPTKTVPVCVLKQYPYRIEHCIQWAQEKFAKLDAIDCKAWFQTNIQDILRQHPKDERNEDGILFWSGSRRCPTSLVHTDWSTFETISGRPLHDETNGDNTAFDKDNDMHLEWVWQASNLRAKVYDIPECTRDQCRAIAGNIMPAVASTTAAVIGLVCLELQKWLDQADVSQHCNSYMNLAEGHCLIQSEPLPPVETKGDETMDPQLGCMVRTWNRKSATCWTRLKVQLQAPATYNALKIKLEEEHSVLVVGMSTMYNKNGIDYNDTNPKSYGALERRIEKGGGRGGESVLIEAEGTVDGTMVYFPIVEIHLV